MASKRLFMPKGDVYIMGVSYLTIYSSFSDSFFLLLFASSILTTTANDIGFVAMPYRRIAIHEEARVRVLG